MAQSKKKTTKKTGGNQNVAMQIIIPHKGQVKVLDANGKPMKPKSDAAFKKAIQKKSVVSAQSITMLKTNPWSCEWVWCDGWYWVCEWK